MCWLGSPCSLLARYARPAAASAAPQQPSSGAADALPTCPPAPAPPAQPARGRRLQADRRALAQCRRCRSDPFDERQEDPAKSRAVESSLWELSALREHYCPQVRPLAQARATGGGGPLAAAACCLLWPGGRSSGAPSANSQARTGMLPLAHLAPPRAARAPRLLASLLPPRQRPGQRPPPDPPTPPR
jgi:hypothetical protein